MTATTSRANAPPAFESLVVWWSEAQSGSADALATLSRVLDAPPDAVARGLRAASGFAAPHHFAIVATTRALSGPARRDHVVERLRVAHEGVLRVLQFPGTEGAFRDLARALLAERPRLESLHGRARLLEELRRDTLREPRLPLPEDLEDLVREAAPPTAGSPPIRGLEESV